jgi:hypothetical protein
MENGAILIFMGSSIRLTLEQMYTLDDHVCFLKTALSASNITDQFLKFAGSRLFFMADLTASNCSGGMLGAFLDFMKMSALPTAAE